MGHNELIQDENSKQIGTRVFETDNNYQAELTKDYGICQSMSAHWILESLKKGQPLADVKEIGSIPKLIGFQKKPPLSEKSPGESALIRLGLDFVQPDANELKKWKDIWNVVLSKKGYLFYTLKNPKRDALHAMGIQYDGQKKQYHFFDPNFGLYRYDTEENLAIALKRHMKSSYTNYKGMNEGKLGEFKLYQINKILPENERFNEEDQEELPGKLETGHFLMSLKPKKENIHFYSAAMIAVWVGESVKEDKIFKDFEKTLTQMTSIVKSISSQDSVSIPAMQQVSIKAEKKVDVKEIKSWSTLMGECQLISKKLGKFLPYFLISIKNPEGGDLFGLRIPPEGKKSGYLLDPRKALFKYPAAVMWPSIATHLKENYDQYKGGAFSLYFLSK